MNPLVSVIIPAYNLEKYIRATVESILSQDYTPIEVIVVDDGSVDNTREALKGFGSRIKCICQNNQGSAAARNAGFNRSKGEYIIFLDGDDLLFPGMVKKAIDALQNNPDYKAVYGIAYRMNEINHTYTEYMYTPRESGNIFESIVKGAMLSQGQYVLHRSILDEVGAFDNEILSGEDWEFQLRITEKLPFLFMPHQFMTKRIHKDMWTLNKPKRIDHTKKRLEILKKTFGSKADKIKKEYITRRIIAEWYYCFDRKWRSLAVYPWQPRLYLELGKQYLPAIPILGKNRSSNGFRRKKDNTKDIKVAISSSGLEHITRGVEASARNLAYALHQKGIDVTLYKGSSNGVVRPCVIEKSLFCLKRNSRPAKIIKKLVPASFWHIGLGSGYDIEQTSYSLLFLLEAIRRQFDIIHTKDPIVANILNFAGRLGLIKSRIIFANGTQEPASFYKNFDYVQHLSPYHMKEAYSDKNNGKMWFAIPNFVDAQRFNPRINSKLRFELGIPEDAFVVIAVSAVKRSHKRIDYLISEVAALSEKRKDVYLIIVGSSTEESAGLLRLGKGLLGNRIIFLLNQQYEKMPKIYRAGDIFVHCSLFEMFANVFIEAMASGLPAIGHKTPIIEWIIRDGGECIDMEAEGELAKTIERYFDDALRKDFSGKARAQVVNNFSKDVIVNQVIDMYKTVLNGN